MKQSQIMSASFIGLSVGFSGDGKVVGEVGVGCEVGVSVVGFLEGFELGVFVGAQNQKE